jgi:HlyD family secretion protein
VPVQSVVHRRGKDQVAVQKPGAGFEWRELTLGMHNDKFVEVKQGIKSGELVAITPLAVLSEQEKRETRGSPTEP